MSETNVKTVKKIKKVVSEPNFIGVDLSKGNDVGTCNGEVLPKVVKKVKKIMTPPLNGLQVNLGLFALMKF